MKTQTSDAVQSAVRFEARIYRDSFTGTKEVRNPETGKWTDEPVTYPAEWGIYDTDNDVRIAYADSKEDAENKVERWNAGKMPTAIAAKVESITDLRKLLKPGDTVKTILRSVSRSGMSRRISLVIARDSDVIDITWDAARAMGDSVKQGGKYVQDAGMVVNGCGMDMGFHIVYSLSRTLFPDGFGATRGIAPVGKEMSTDVGRGITRCRRPISRDEIAECVNRGWKFRGRNGDASGWDTDGGYALKQGWL